MRMSAESKVDKFYKKLYSISSTRTSENVHHLANIYNIHDSTNYQMYEQVNRLIIQRMLRDLKAES